LIATLQPGSGASQQSIHIVAKATKGTGREHARFCPTSQCSYVYTPDKNPDRIQERFDYWLQVTKKAGSIDRSSDRFKILEREFYTMEVNRCYLMDEKNEPYSFDFTIESAGVLPVPYIIERACEVGENMCSRYTQFDSKDLPSEITIRTTEARITGFDITFRKQDHTLGNLLQTWIEQNLIDRPDSKVTYIGYAIPHPLRDEMLLRIGVSDGEEKTARAAIALAAKGCAELFHQFRNAWRKAMGRNVIVPASTRKVIRRAVPSSSSSSASTEAPIKVNVTKSE
jgi:DNA-directed RNA polymerase subunit L